MTDRELLELAAKAAGVKGTWQQWTDSRDFVSCGIAPDRSSGSEWWNPLRDDGEALRLAVKLRIFPMPDEDECVAMFASLSISVREPNANDPNAAARRAIVRAAAAIGEAMP